MEIRGKIKSIGVTESFGDRDFKVAKFRLDLTRFNPDTGDEYANEAEFQVTGTRTEIMSALSIGDKVELTFNIKGKEVDKKDGSGKVFIQNLEAFKITVLEKGGVQVNAPSVAAPVIDISGASKEDDDLPF